MNPRFSKKKIAIFLIFISVATLLGVVALRQKIIRPKAAGTPILAFSTAAPITSGDFDLILKVNPNGAQFNAFHIFFTFDADKVSLRDPTNLASNFERIFDSDLPLTKVVLTGNKIELERAKTGPTPFFSSGEIDLIKVKMSVKSGATGKVDFSWDPATTIPNASRVTLQNADLPISGGVKSAKLYFSSAKPTPAYNPGENLDVDLYLDTGKDAVAATSFQFDFNYDSTKVTFQNPGGSDDDLATNNIVFNSGSGFTPFIIKVISSEKIMLNGAVGTNPAVTGIVKLATVKLKIKDGTAGQAVSFTALDTSLVYDANTQNILGERPTYTINLDGQVNIIDLDILARNFGIVGDQ